MSQEKLNEKINLRVVNCCNNCKYGEFEGECNIWCKKHGIELELDFDMICNDWSDPK